MDGVNRNLKVSVITPNGAVYDMVSADDTGIPTD